MKKLTYYGLISICCLTFLAACGGSNKNTEEKQDTITTTNDDKKGEPATNEIGKSENDTASSNNIPKDTTLEQTKVEGEQTKEGEEVKSVEGTFTGLEQGDLFYFNVKDTNGKDWSFTVGQTDKTYNDVSLNEAAYKGKKVKVFYQKKKEFIEAAGGEIEMLAYKKAEFVK